MWFKHEVVQEVEMQGDLDHGMSAQLDAALLANQEQRAAELTVLEKEIPTYTKDLGDVLSAVVIFATIGLLCHCFWQVLIPGTICLMLENAHVRSLYRRRNELMGKK